MKAADLIATGVIVESTLNQHIIRKDKCRGKPLQIDLENNKHWTTAWRYIRRRAQQLLHKAKLGVKETFLRQLDLGVASHTSSPVCIKDILAEYSGASSKIVTFSGQMDTLWHFKWSTSSFRAAKCNTVDRCRRYARGHNWGLRFFILQFRGSLFTTTHIHRIG